MFSRFKFKFGLQISIFASLIFLQTICFAEDDSYTELLVSMKVNYEDSEEIADILISKESEVFIPLEIIKKFKVNDAYLKSSLQKINDIEYVNISTLKKTSIILDQANLAIDIKFPTNQMITQSLNATNFDNKLLNNSIREAAKGSFLNYNFTFTKTNNQSNMAGTPSLQYFTKAGNLQSSFLISNHKIGNSKQNIVRLDTNWTTHNVEKMAQWRIGDSITKAASWSGSTRFFGLQYATDFSVRPDFIPFPLANFTGSANLPSTVDVYLNSSKVYQQQVKQGPFAINNLPVTTGDGNIVIETQDITGKRTTIVMPYYVAPSLLKKGIANFSYEAGISRDQYATSSSKYRYLLTNADYSYGINDVWTTSAHFESMRQSQSLGLTNTLKLGDLGLISASVASNLPKPDHAQNYTFSYGYQTSSFSFNTAVSSSGRRFVDSFSYPTQVFSRPKLIASFTYNNERYGQFFIGFTTSKSGGIPSRRIDFTYDKSIVANSFFRFALGTDLDKKRGSTSCILSLNMVIGEKNTNVGVSNGYQSGIRTRTIEVSNPVSKPIDWGYRILLQDNKTVATNSKIADFDLGLSGQNSIGTATLRAYEQGKNPGQEASFSGSIVAMKGELFLAPPIQQSLALVKVGVIPNIPIYYNNQIIGKTNKKGLSLTPNVVPYVPSQIKIDDQALPLDMSVPSMVQNVAPPAGGGVIADFKARRSKGVEMRMIDDDKTPLNLNYSVKIEGIKEELFLGYNGILYIENVSELKNLKGKICDFQSQCCDFNTPINLKNPDPIVEMGDILCHSNIAKPNPVPTTPGKKGTTPAPKAKPEQPKAPGPNS